MNKKQARLRKHLKILVAAHDFAIAILRTWLQMGHMHIDFISRSDEEDDNDEPFDPTSIDLDDSFNDTAADDQSAAPDGGDAVPTSDTEPESDPELEADLEALLG